MIIEINKKKYLLRVGNRAAFYLNNNLDKKELKAGKLDFDFIVELYWRSMPDKGNLTKSKVEDYVDATPHSAELIMNEISAFNTLSEQAKK